MHPSVHHDLLGYFGEQARGSGGCVGSIVHRLDLGLTARLNLRLLQLHVPAKRGPNPSVTTEKRFKEGAANAWHRQRERACERRRGVLAGRVVVTGAARAQRACQPYP